MFISAFCTRTLPLFIIKIIPEEYFTSLALSCYETFSRFMPPPFFSNFSRFWSWQLFFLDSFSSFWNNNFMPSSLSFWVFIVMHSLMFRAVSQNKVLNSIIKFISVNMMDYFSRFQCSFKMFFHYQSLFKEIFSIYIKFLITSWCYCSSSIRSFKSFFNHKPSFVSICV